MNISLEYFLAVAEEESISRAAERVMVSQQDMSNHIRRLEKQYGLLFERRPRFALTPAGEAVLATYRQVRLLEESLEDRLRDLREDTEGTIRLGMHIARARILVPPAAARFCREFPHVRLEVVHGRSGRQAGAGDAAPVPGCRSGGASPLLLHAGGLGDSLSRDCRGPAGPLLPSRGRGGYH